MRLCFGTFATILYNCRQDLNQAGLVERIAKAVDPETRYVIGKTPDNQKSEANKLLKCTKRFILSNRKDTYESELTSVINNFKEEVAPLIDEDKKATVILALLDIIRRDEYLESNKKENFKKYFGVEKKDLLKKREFIFSDFLGRALMYTVCGNVDNTVGKEYVKSITCDYINNAGEPYIYEYQWNSDKQKLTLSFVDMFNIINIFQQSISEYQIDYFLTKIDPTNRMHDESRKKCVSFIKYMELKILVLLELDPTSESDPILMKIRQFNQTLDDYTNYLGLRMRPIAELPDILVPLYRDENLKWALKFEEETINYRSQLIRACEDIAKSYNIRESSDLKPVRKPKNSFNE